MQVPASWVYPSLARDPGRRSRSRLHRACVGDRDRGLCLRLDHGVGRGHDPHHLDHPWSYGGFDRLGHPARHHHHIHPL